MSISNLLVPNSYNLYCKTITPSTGGGGGGGSVGNLTAVLTQGNNAGNLTITNVRSLEMNPAHGSIFNPFVGNPSLGFDRETDESALFEYYHNTKNPMTRLFTSDGINAQFKVFGSMESISLDVGEIESSNVTVTNNLVVDNTAIVKETLLIEAPDPRLNLKGVGAQFHTITAEYSSTAVDKMIMFYVAADEGQGNGFRMQGNGTMFVPNGVLPFTGVHEGKLYGAKPKIGQVMSAASATVKDVSNCEFSLRICESSHIPFGVFSGEGKDKHIHINSVGEGAVLALRDDLNPILAGDYLQVSSSRRGYVEKAKSQQMSKWIVGKAIVDVEWEDEDEMEKLIPVVYTCG